MVLNDVTTEYQSLIDVLEKYNTENSFINSALYIINTYHAKINNTSSTYIHSAKSSRDADNLVSDIRSITGNYAQYIAYMNSGIRNTTLLISELQAIDFQSASIQEYADAICECLNNLLDIIETYSAAKINNHDTSFALFDLIDEADHFKGLYTTVVSNGEFLASVEDELLDAPPDYIDEEQQIYTLDVRSYKPSSNLSTFVSDLQLLVDSLSQMESVLLPGEGSAIFLRKIESGSLKALLGSTKIDISIFPDIISSLSQAIHTFRMTPGEKEQLKANTNKTEADANKSYAEAQLIEAQAKKVQIETKATELQIINSQIDFLIDRLGLDASSPENREKIQQLCIPVLKFLESNPKGQFNDYKYDISEKVQLLEEK